MWPAVIHTRVDMLWWPRIAAEFHGVSSQIGRIKTNRKGVFSTSKEASSAWRTVLIISSGSYRGLAIHEPAHRYRKESLILPKVSFSRKAEHQYERPVVIEHKGAPEEIRFG
jgi:hypothetical protein